MQVGACTFMNHLKISCSAKVLAGCHQTLRARQRKRMAHGELRDSPDPESGFGVQTGTRRTGTQ